MITSLFIDQPVGVGFSFGSATVGTSQQAAKDVWTVSTNFTVIDDCAHLGIFKFLQIWFKDKRFAGYENNDFGIWTESYVLSIVVFMSTIGLPSFFHLDTVDTMGLYSRSKFTSGISFMSQYQHFMLHLRYFLEQDAKIFAGELIATPLNLQVLGIGDGIVVRMLANVFLRTLAE